MSISRQEYLSAQSDVFRAQATIENSLKTKANLQQIITANQSASLDFSEQLVELDIVNVRISAAETNLKTANSTIDQFLTQTTIPSESAISTIEKYQTADATDATDEYSYDDSNNFPGYQTQSLERTVPGVPAGAQPLRPQQAKVNFNLLGDKEGEKDLRVRIRVPSDYLTPTTTGPAGQLATLGGIIFPYTPSINYELKADYSPTNPIHSNFSINFYQRSSISDISIVGKFTVENQTDAGIYIATVHLLKALTRMRFGGDKDAGAPPPVCRLYAYGQMMLENVPVAITSFRIELPDNVDYFTFRDYMGEPASVPTVSTISLVCKTMYSRNEMQGFSVSRYLNNEFKGKGII
jgi:hypothetical protein